MAEESKNEYAAQLQRFNRDQAHFYFSQMPQIFDVSALSLLTKSLKVLKPPRDGCYLKLSSYGFQKEIKRTD